jgi:hypothetical protein
MPFYCGKRSAGICVVLGPKTFSTYFSEYAAGFSEPRHRICHHLLSLATKDDSDRLLAEYWTRAFNHAARSSTNGRLLPRACSRSAQHPGVHTTS